MADLQRALADMGFQLHKDVAQDKTFNVRMQTYKFFEKGRSAKGVWVTYHEGTYDDDAAQWASFAPELTVVATVTVSTYAGRSRFDEAKQQEIARVLRDRYGAVLYDPQDGNVVTN